MADIRWIYEEPEEFFARIKRARMSACRKNSRKQHLARVLKREALNALNE